MSWSKIDALIDQLVQILVIWELYGAMLQIFNISAILELVSEFFIFCCILFLIS